MAKQDPYPNPPYHCYEPTLEERVERLEKETREIQRWRTLDWETIAPHVVIIILAVLGFTLALVKC